MYKHSLSRRVRVLILGGGIHGVGLLHDLLSRGWQDVQLIEKSKLASGTSSRSTKLIHGGLRYLQRLSQFPMVSESLSERQFLLKVAHDIVTPLEMIIPIKTQNQAWFATKIRLGLFLYDRLAGQANIRRHRILPESSVREKAPILDVSRFNSYLSFWDAQTDDLALVQRVAASAVKLGGTIREECEAVRIQEDGHGWRVDLRYEDGVEETVSALYVINCLGPWANKFLQESKIEPPYQGINNKGSHILCRDLGLNSGLFLRAGGERVVFVLPWKGHTLIGTTESLYEGDLNRLVATQEEVDYLLGVCNDYLKEPLREKDILGSFAGLRWLAVEKSKSLSSTSRETLVGETFGQRGLLLTIYGGKLTSYRSLAEKIGDRITHHFGEFRPSKTSDLASWITHDTDLSSVPSLRERFFAS